MNLAQNLTPAVFSYEGLQYQYMAPSILEEDQLVYLENTLRILSGFYGILKPFDGIVPYRLEMQTKLPKDNLCEGHNSLYDFWGNKIAENLFEETDTIINLASAEYSKVIEKYLPDHIQYITCVFGEKIEDRVVEKGTYAKMARGEMVRYLAEIKAHAPGDMKSFHRMGYVYNENRSTSNKYVFIKIK